MSRRPLLLLLPALLVLLGLPGSGLAPAFAATPTTGQSTYVPVDPSRILDRTVVGDHATLDITPPVPVGTTAVVLNVTATASSGGTDVRVYPTPADASVPNVSNLNVVRGATAANLVVVRLGAGGQVRIRNTAGTVVVIVDLQGYDAPDGSGAGYTGSTPVRLVDGSSVGPAGVLPVQVTGCSGCAPAGAVAVALNVTGYGATQQTDLRVYPSTDDGSYPRNSNANPPRGRAVAAAAVVKTSTDGRVSVRNAAGTVRLKIDLTGWYTPSAAGDVPAAVFHPLPPRRIVDFTTPVVGPAGTLDVTVAGSGSVPFPGSAVVLNVTAVGPTRTTDIRVYPTPAGGGVSGSSNLNVVAGQALPNAVLATVGVDGKVRLYNSAGSVHLLVDLSGWYGPAGDGHDISWPQCRPDGTSSHPTDGGFAVIGLNNGRPFTANPCFADEWSWAGTLPGHGAVYLNVNAAGSADPAWDDPGPASCDARTPVLADADPGCGYNWGWHLGSYSIARLPGGTSKPQVFLDVEGNRQSGGRPIWQASQGVNAGVIKGLSDRLRAAGLRIGAYSNPLDWARIAGSPVDARLQNWWFQHPSVDTAELDSYCGAGGSFSGGPVVLRQYQTPGESPIFDHNHPC